MWGQTAFVPAGRPGTGTMGHNRGSDTVVGASLERRLEHMEISGSLYLQKEVAGSGLRPLPRYSDVEMRSRAFRLLPNAQCFITIFRILVPQSGDLRKLRG